MKLDIGSGDVPAEGTGWTTVDLYDPSADVKADAADLPFDDGSVDEVWASHVLEHLEHPAAALTEWHRVLRVAGRLAVEVPDLLYLCRLMLSRTEDDWAMAGLYGSDYPGRRHLTNFTQERLSAEIVAAGFELPRIEVVWSHGMECLSATTCKG